MRGELCRQTPVNRGHAFGQREHVVDDRVSDFTVEVAQFRLGVAVNRDTEGRDATDARLPESLARVFACVARVAVIVVVRTAVRENDEEACARLLSAETGGGVADGRAEPRGSIGTVPVIDLKTTPTSNGPKIGTRAYVYRPLYLYLLKRTPDALEIVYRHVDRNTPKDRLDPNGSLLSELKKKMKQR